MVKYCRSRNERCSVSDDFISGADAPAAEAAEALQEERLARTLKKFTTFEKKGNAEERIVNSDEEMSKEVSDSDKTTSLTEEKNDDKISDEATSDKAEQF